MGRTKARLWMSSHLHSSISVAAKQRGACMFDSFPFVFQVLCNSKNSIIRECFLSVELDNRRRPETVSCFFSSTWKHEEEQSDFQNTGFGSLSLTPLPLLVIHLSGSLQGRTTMADFPGEKLSSAAAREVTPLSRSILSTVCSCFRAIYPLSEGVLGNHMLQTAQAQLGF